MKNKKIYILAIAFGILCFFNTTHASINVNANVDVPPSCAVTDATGIIHNYPQTNSYLAICAFDAARNSGAISDIQLTNFSFGLFITGVNGLIADPVTQYWKLQLDNTDTIVGVSDLTLQLNNIVSLALITFDPVTFAETPTGDQVTIHINSLIPPPPVTGSGMLLNSSDNISTTTTVATEVAETQKPAKPTFDIAKGFQFLSAQQKDNGSFGEDLYTDWAALALATGNNQDQTIKLIRYFAQNNITGSLLTDYERHAMALMSLGLNPYNTNGVNYIEKIVASFDGKQFGDAHEDNDDVFALIVLQNAGYDQNDKMISDDINFVLSTQNENGSWDNSIDMTGATMEALSIFDSDQKVKDALGKAVNFLKQNQKDNGGWNDSASSTAWAMEGMNNKPEEWKKTDNTPTDYLATLQDIDGGIKNENLNNKIWETAYVLQALSGKTWNQTMQKFTKVETPIKTITSTPRENTENPTTGIVSVKKIKKDIAKVNTEDAPIQNTATVLDAVNIANETQTETTHRNWFMRVLGNIFRF